MKEWWNFRHSIDPNRYRRKIEKLRKAFLRRVSLVPLQNSVVHTKKSIQTSINGFPDP
jgi:hypothetical protein